MRPLRLGMVGGGLTGNIGATHRMAAALDGRYRLVAGALSSRPSVARESAEAFGLERSYADWRQMARDEAARPDGIEVVSIVTPNHLHREMTEAFLEAGIHVILDKPLTTNLEDGLALAERVRAAEAVGTRFLLTHPYCAYPLIREARRIVAEGQLGKLRVAQVEYAQDWLARDLPDSPQATWRGDPAMAGPAGALGDIGTHAFQLLRYVSGLAVTEVAADLQSHVTGRRVDDNVHAMLRLDNGATGMLWASQVAPGRENGLRLRLYGEDGALEFDQENPNELQFSRLGQPQITFGRAGHGTGSVGVRVPSGHPEGYLEAFANLYNWFADLLQEKGNSVYLPGIDDGLEGMAFINAVLASDRANGTWVPLS